MFSLFVTFIYNVLKKIYGVIFRIFVKPLKMENYLKIVLRVILRKKKTFHSLDRKKEHQQIFHGVKTYLLDTFWVCFGSSFSPYIISKIYG